MRPRALNSYIMLLIRASPRKRAHHAHKSDLTFAAIYYKKKANDNNKIHKNEEENFLFEF